MVDVNQPLKIIENIIRENAFEQRKKENRSTNNWARGSSNTSSSCRKQVNLRSCWVDCGFKCVFTLHFAYYLIDGTREYKPHLSPQTVRNSFEYQVMCLNGTVHTNSPTIKRQHCSGGFRGGAREPRPPSYLRVWITAPHPISRALDPALH